MVSLDFQLSGLGKDECWAAGEATYPLRGVRPSRLVLFWQTFGLPFKAVRLRLTNRSL